VVAPPDRQYDHYYRYPYANPDCNLGSCGKVVTFDLGDIGIGDGRGPARLRISENEGLVLHLAYVTGQLRLVLQLDLDTSISADTKLRDLGFDFLSKLGLFLFF
jgi:hypothetical protein